MKFFRLILALLFSAVFGIGCASTPWWHAKTQPTLPDAPQSSWGYTPIDPLPVYFKELWTGRIINEEVNNVLDLLPDETMRIAIGQIQQDGNILYGPAKAGIAGNKYVVVLDYIKFNTNYVDVDFSGQEAAKTAESPGSKVQLIKVPLYIGVGLRLTANVSVNEGSLDLSNLFALGAAAQAKQVSGTMVVQTLGISGEKISTLIPMPSEINPSTIQNVLLSLGSVKAKIYDPGTKVSPRAVGIYKNFEGGQQTIHRIISSILYDGAFLFIKPDETKGKVPPMDLKKP